MKLCKDGITIDATDSESGRFLRLGYQKVEEEPVVETGSDNPESISIEQIYALCEKAGVKPDDLKLSGEHPTLAEVKAAIKAAKKAGD